MNDNDPLTPAQLGMSPDEWEREKAMARATMTPEIEKAVRDFTRVCEQTGLIDKLRKEPEPSHDT